MYSYSTLNELTQDVKNRISSLYAKDPLTYAYPYYDLITPEEAVRTSLSMDKDSMVLIWKGLGRNDILIYGDAVKLIPDVEVHNIQTYNLENVDLISSRFPWLKATRYIDMVCESPEPSAVVTRLRDEDLDMLVKVREISTGMISYERANRLIGKTFGVKIDGKLVSIGSFLVKLPEVWIIGGVFTLPEYRGRGYAGEIVKTMAWEVRRNGAIPLLHVREDNIPAIRSYSRVGCREIRRRWWLI